MEYVVLVVVVGGFAAFIYSRVRKSKKTTGSVGSGGGGGGKGDSWNVNEK
jgi:hypothetical protein